jgi:hypothetical protein
VKKVGEIRDLCVGELKGWHAGTPLAQNNPDALTLDVFEHER